MSKYHAASKYGTALCGSRRLDGFKTVVVGASDWNDTKPVFRCAKCVAFLQQRKLEAKHKATAG
jgi:hypothetical protein